jgi:hypothetical protein
MASGHVLWIEDTVTRFGNRLLALERRQPSDLAGWRIDMLRFLQSLLGLRSEWPRPRDLTEAEQAANPWTANLLGLIKSVEVHPGLPRLGKKN